MDDKDKVLDSIVHHEERAARMRAASEEIAQLAAKAEIQRQAQQAQRELTARHARADELEAKAGLIHENETREMLLDRIRKLREEKPAEIVHVGYRSPEQQATFEAEQKAGREAVARAEAEIERIRDYWRQQTETAAKQASGPTPWTVSPVHHPNPSQDEQYPAVKATLGKPNDRPKIR
jgi:hypothetical protein